MSAPLAIILTVMGVLWLDCLRLQRSQRRWAEQRDRDHRMLAAAQRSRQNSVPGSVGICANCGSPVVPFGSDYRCDCGITMIPRRVA